MEVGSARTTPYKKLNVPRKVNNTPHKMAIRHSDNAIFKPNYFKKTNVTRHWDAMLALLQVCKQNIDMCFQSLLVIIARSLLRQSGKMLLL